MAMDDAAIDPWADHPSPYIARLAYREGQRALDDWLRKEIRMTDNNDTGISRTFAGMLGELEDQATRLTVRQAELAGELAQVEDELHRIEAVREIMAGKPPKKKRGRPAGNVPQRQSTADRAERIIAWARERGGEFTGAEVADALDIGRQGVGPVLSGMVRRGEMTVRDGDDGRHYTLG